MTATPLAEPRPPLVKVEPLDFTQIFAPKQPKAIVADVVFIHGLGGHPRNTWTYKGDQKSSKGEGSQNTPKKSSFRSVFGKSKKTKGNNEPVDEPTAVSPDCFWPEDLLARDFPNIRILTYGYDSNVTQYLKGAANQMTITQHARTLLQKLVDERVDQPDRPLIFVAHSLGGLLVKDAIIESQRCTPKTLHRAVFENCHAIMFFGTPHQGSNLADWGLLLSNIVKALGSSTYKGILSQLRPDSEKLDILTRDFNSILDSDEKRIEIYSFQEGKGLTAVSLLDRKVVPDASSCFNRRNIEQITHISENHMNMCRFKRSNDAGYKSFSSGLKRYLLAVPSAKQGPDDEMAQSVSEFREIATGIPESERLLVSSESYKRQSQLWFWKSPEYLDWVVSGSSKFLWCTTKPGFGKSVIAAELVSNLFASQIHSENIAYISPDLLGANPSILGPGIAVISIIVQLFHAKLSQEKGNENAVTLGGKEREMLLRAVKQGITLCDTIEKDLATAYIPETPPHSENDLWKVLESLVRSSLGQDIYIIIDSGGTLSPQRQLLLVKNIRHLWNSAQTPLGPNLKILLLSRPVVAINELLEGLPHLDADNELKGCLASLKLGATNTRQSRVDNCEQHTGDWILQHTQYLKWKSRKTSSVLWLQGKPGSGKSVLMKHLLRTLNITAGTKEDGARANQQPVTASFFFSAREGESETSHRHMLQHLLYKVLEQDSSLYLWFQETYRRLRDEAKQEMFWGYKDLKQIFRSLTTYNEQSLIIYLVVDALDESDNSGLSDVLKLFQNFVNGSSCVIKIVFASRPSELVERSLVSDRHHIILEHENEKDISNMIDVRLQFLKKSTDVLFEWTARYLREHAQGVFLWVSIIIKEIEDWRTGGYSESEIKDMVREFPVELVDYYQRIIKQLGLQKPRVVAEAKKVLDWATYTERPLTAGEFWDIIAVDVDRSQGHYEFLESRLSGLDDVRKRIRRDCGDLLDIKRPTTLVTESTDLHPQDVIQLIHQTAREFLTSPDKAAGPFSTNEMQGNNTIAIVCARYIITSLPLTRDWFDDQNMSLKMPEHWNDDDSLQFISYLESRHLLSYALMHLQYHLSRVKDPFPEALKLLETFWEQIRIADPSYTQYILEPWFKGLQFPQNPKTMSETASDFRIANIVLSISNGSENAIRALVITQRPLDYVDTKSNYTPLQSAAAVGSLDTIDLLMQHGTKINFNGGYFGNALQVAAFHGQEAALQKFLEYGADVNQIGGHYGSALQAAAFKGQEAVVRQLLQKGADPNVKAGFFTGPLLAAVCFGHIGVAKMLVHNSADLIVDADHLPIIFDAYTPAKIEETLIETLVLLYGQRDTRTLGCMDIVANIWKMAKKFDAAENLTKRVIKLYGEVQGPEAISTVFAMSRLGDIYLGQGRDQDAEELFKKTLELNKRDLPAADTSITLGIFRLASLYMAQERYTEAEELLVDVLKGPTPLDYRLPWYRDGSDLLITIYEKQGRSREAKEQALRVPVLSKGSDEIHVEGIDKDWEWVWEV